MVEANFDLRVILIGGTSNTGKSTLAQALASKLGWRYISTDKLARHPGRPWRVRPATVPEHVAHHYLSLTTEELFTEVLRHYGRMWPDVKAIINLHATDRSAEPLVMEGSALWPDFVATLELDNVGAIWLTGSDDLLRARIYSESRFKQASGRERAMIQSFLWRTQLYNDRMLASVRCLGLPSLDVEQASSPEELSSLCLALLKKLFSA